MIEKPHQLALSPITRRIVHARVPGVAVFTSLREVRKAENSRAEAVHALHHVPVGVAHDEAPDLVGAGAGRAIVGPPAAKGHWR